MRWLTLLALVFLTACGPTFEEPFAGADYGALSGVWGSSSEDVFIVGGTFEQAEIVHLGRDGWSDIEAPPVPLLAWVHVWSATEAMAVGVDGAAATWDGSSWTELSTPTERDLWGVWGPSPDDVWVVGGDATDTEGEPVILHWDGSAFTEYDLDPAENPNGAVALFKVWGIGDTVFIVGQEGTILKWDGADWLRTSAGGLADRDFISLTGTAEDRIVAVGGRGNARIAVWDGSAWETFAPSAVGGLNAVSMPVEGRALVGGVNGYVGIFDVETGELEPETALPGGDVHAIWSDENGTSYLVGGRFVEPFAGLVRTRRGAL